jgi:hypothetical protein
VGETERSDAELAGLEHLGVAQGDLGPGRAVDSHWRSRLRHDPIGAAALRRDLDISPESIKATPRRIALAGRSREHEAIRGALRGGWADVVITDRWTAEFLLAD